MAQCVTVRDNLHHAFCSRRAGAPRIEKVLNFRVAHSSSAAAERAGLDLTPAGCRYLSEPLSNQKRLPLAEVAGYAERNQITREWESHMKKPVPAESASKLIDRKIRELGDWRGKALAKVREIVLRADSEIVEEWKWMGTPVWSRGGIVCTGETYKSVVKMTFARGVALQDPAGLFNSSLDGNVRRAIDIHEGEKIDEAALQELIRAAVALNLKARSKPGRANSKWAG
jgi:hypothetical protein